MIRLVIKHILLLVVFGTLVPALYSQTTLLSGNEWKFRKAGDEEWMSASVPGFVHLDLIDNHVLKDPYFGLNESEQQWIEKEDWEYSLTFNVDSLMLQQDNIDIIFEGLDTYADVYINNHLLINTNNFFRSWRADIKEFLYIENNILRIYFHSPVNFVMPQYKSLPFRYPNSNDQSDIKTAMFTRKPGYHFGWDWGPRFVTSGIWKDIKLMAWSKERIDNVWIRQLKLDSDSAILMAQVSILGQADTKAGLALTIGDQVIDRQYEISKGTNIIKIPVVIKEPKLWWPNGMGEQYLYNVKLELLKSNGETDVYHERIGLRSIEVIAKPDSLGHSFYFNINGQSLFAKGTNYIPQDIFLTRVEKEDYTQLLNSCVNANMNMIRVWGGGIYENKEFYDLCDELGLLVWQDFMFACSMYPGNKAFIENVEKEAIENVIRLRNHPCIALWCGNNEIEVAFNHWKEFKDLIENHPFTLKDYNLLFEKILPRVVDEYDSSTFYISSSPTSFTKNVSPRELTHGDNHYWKVWSSGEDFFEYKHNVARFMSEYGFLSYPFYSALAHNAHYKDLNVNSRFIAYRSRWSKKVSDSLGWALTIPHTENYIQQNYLKPDSFRDFLYKSQLIQADAIKYAVLQHRKNKPFCMGTLYWQLNDVWPGASWSSIDYYGSWKPLHFELKRVFDKVVVFIEPLENKVDISIISDDRANMDASALIWLYDFNGDVVDKKVVPIKIIPTKASNISLDFSDEFFNGKGKNDLFIKVDVVSNGILVATDDALLDRAKNVTLKNANVAAEIISKGRKQYIKLKTDKPAFGVWVEYNALYKNVLEDNFITVLPDDPVFLLLNDHKKYRMDEFEIFWINKE